MIKIWAKVMIGDKIKKDFVAEFEEKFESRQFFSYVCTICEKLDIPTPVILKSHIANFVNFNNARFKAGDFVQTVPFTSFVLENIPL